MAATHPSRAVRRKVGCGFVRLSIAGIGCAVEGLADTRLGQQAAERYRAFSKGVDTETDITAHISTRPPDPGFVSDADEPVVFVDRLTRDRISIRRIDNPFEAVVDLAARRAEVDLDDNLYCLDSFLRILYSVMLARDGGLLLHSAAVACGGRAGLLVGVSEAGKTTLCRQGFDTVLSDELVAIRRTAEGFRAFGTPFWGEFVAGPVREEADVGAVYLLRKGPRNEVLPAAVTQAVMEVLGCVFFFGPHELSESVLGLAGELVESRLAGEFYFRPEPSVVGFLDKELSAHAS